MITPDLAARVDARLAELLVAVRKKRPEFPTPRITYFDNRLSAGTARLGDNEIQLNAILLQENEGPMLHETVAHELAHLVVTYDWYAGGRSSHRPPSHGSYWRSIMYYELKVAPERTHNFDVTNVRARVVSRHVYRCDCGVRKLTAIRHNRIVRAGTVYRCRKCAAALVLA